MAYAIQREMILPLVMRPWDGLGLHKVPRQYEINFKAKVGSGPYDRISTEATTACAVLRYTTQTLSVAEQVHLIETHLGLNRSQTATALGVTRKAVYDWLGKGAHLTDLGTEDRLRNLTEIARLQTDKSIGKFIGMNLQRPVYGKISLLDVLVADDIDVGMARSMLERVTTMALASQARAEAKAKKRPSPLPDYEAQVSVEHFSPRS